MNDICVAMLRRELQSLGIYNYEDCERVAREYGFTGPLAYLCQDDLDNEGMDLADFIYDVVLLEYEE